jgi:hypothetical protein
MGRYIRIIKADEGEGEKPPEKKPKRRRMSEEEAIKLGREGLEGYMNNLKENPPRYAEGQVPEGQPDDINYDLLYNTILYANNIMFADLFGLDEEARMKSLPEEGKASIMSQPMLTKPVLYHLDKMIEHFGDELGYRKIMDEEDNGALKDDMKRNFVPHEISHRIQQGLESPKRSLDYQKAQKNVLRSLKGLSSHPISGTTLQDMEDVKVRGVRVAPSRGQRAAKEPQMPAALQEQMDDLAGKAREQLGDLSADGRLKDRERAAREFYQQKVFPRMGDYDAFKARTEDIDMKISSKAGNVALWSKMIQAKANKEGIPVEQAVPLVQEDFNRYMRVFLGTDAVGSAGRGGKFGSEATAGRADDMVTPSFYMAAKRFNVRLTSPNATEQFGRFFTKGDAANSRKNRELMAETPISDEERQGLKMHPAIDNAYDEAGIFRQIAESEGDRGSRLAVPDLRAGPRQQAERAGETTAVGTDLSDVKIETKRDLERAKRFISSERGADEKTNPLTRDYRLVDIDRMLRNGLIEENEHAYHFAQIMANKMSDYTPTYFSETPTGADFPEGHPYRDLSEGEIEEKSRNFMDMLVGSGRHIYQFKKRLEKLGLPVKEIQALKLHAIDMENIHSILHDDDPYTALSRFNDAQQKRYQRVLETGVSAGYLNKLNKDLMELRQITEDIGIDPIDIAEMGMQYADSGFTRQGYEDAFLKMFGRYGGDVNKGAMLRTLYAWKRANDRRSKVLEREEEKKQQMEPFMEHYQMSEEERGKNDLKRQPCKACDLKHFSNEGPNKDHPHLRGQASAHVYSSVMLPQLDYRWNTDTKKNEDISVTLGDDSLLSMGAYLFAEGDEEEYMEKKLRYYGLAGEEGEVTDVESKNRRDRRVIKLGEALKKEIKKAVIRTSSPYHAKAQKLAKEFGLDVRDRVVRPRGFAMRTPFERQALGLIHPSAFHSDAEREQTRIHNLTAAQFSGVVEAFDLVQDMKSGAIRDGKKPFDMKKLRDRSERRKAVASLFKENSSAAQANARNNRFQLLKDYLASDIDGYKAELARFDAQYRQRMTNGDLTKEKNRAGYVKVNNMWKERKRDFADDITQTFQRLTDKTMSLAKNGVKGRNYIEVSERDFQLHNVGGFNKGLEISLGGQPNTVIDLQPPRREGDTYKLKLKTPLEQDIYAKEGQAEDGTAVDRTELQITDDKHRNKLLTFDLRADFFQQALGGNIEDMNEFVKKFNQHTKRIENNAKRLDGDVDFNKHRTQMALGAFLNIGDKLEGLVGKKKGRALFDELSKMTTELYTDAEGMPIPDVFMSDGYGEEFRNFRYRPDEYLTGQLGQTGGTGVTYMQNNRVGYSPTDAEMLQAISLKQHGVKISGDRLLTAKDAYHAAGLGPLEKEAVKEMVGDDDDDLTEDDVNEGEKGDLLDDFKDEETDVKMNEHRVRQMIHRQSFDADGNQEHWVHNSATGCGLCGGSGSVTLDDAIAFIQANNPALTAVNPNSDKMKEYISKNIRPTDGDLGDYDGQHNVACPECDQEHPDAVGGRCADGLCANCHGSGYLDPDSVDDYFGEYKDEDGNVYHGRKHNPHYGEHYDESDLNRLIQQRLREEGVGKTEKANFTSQMHRDAVQRGLIAPLTKIDYIKNLNKNRYAEKPQFARKEFDLEAYRRASSKIEDWGEKTKEEQQATGDPTTDAMRELGTSTKVLDSYEKAHHEHLITKRAQDMADLALRKEADPQAVQKALDVILNNKEMLSKHQRARSPAIRQAMKELHELSTPQRLDKKGRRVKPPFSLDEAQVQLGRNIPHEQLTYDHGRWLTDAENDENLFAPYSKARPHLAIKDLKQMFGHSKPLMGALNRYLDETKFDPEKGEAILQLLSGVKKPLVMQQLGGISHPDLSLLYDEFNASAEEREHENKEMEEPQLRWDKGVLDEMHALGVSPSKVQEYLSVPTEEGDYGFNQGLRKGLDKGFNRGVNDILKPMMVEFATLSMVKHFLNYYDDISHPNFHAKVQDAMKSEGHSADTRLSVDNFFEMTRMRGDLQKFAYNEAARMFGYEDYEALEKSLDFTKRSKDFGGTMMSGEEFKEKALAQAKPIKSKKQALPMDLNQLYAESVAQQMSLSPEAQMQDENIVAQMEELALYRHYPNWMRAQAMMNIMTENGYGDSGDFADALKNGQVPEEVKKQVLEVNMKARMFHPTISFAGFDETEQYDAIAHEQYMKDPNRYEISRRQALGEKQGPMMQEQVFPQRPVGSLDPTFAQPPSQPQPQSPPPQSPLGMGAQRNISVSNLADTRGMNQTVDEKGNIIQRDPPVQAQAGVVRDSPRDQLSEYQRRMAQQANPYNRPLPDEDSQ